MKPTLLPPTLVVLLIIVVLSCHKETSGKTELEKRKDALQTYVSHKHFIPVDFYADRAIDYNEDDSNQTRSTDLKPFILPYLSDDKIVFEDNNRLHVDQGPNQYERPADEPQLDSAFDTNWSIETSKAKNEVYLNYLSYTYYPERYTVDTFNDAKMVAHIRWRSKKDINDTANLYTRFEKR